MGRKGEGEGRKWRGQLDGHSSRRLFHHWSRARGQLLLNAEEEGKRGGNRGRADPASYIAQDIKRRGSRAALISGSQGTND